MEEKNLKNVSLWIRVKPDGKQFEIRLCRLLLWSDLQEFQTLKKEIRDLEKLISEFKEKGNILETRKQLEVKRRQLKVLESQMKFENYLVVAGCGNIMAVGQNYQNPANVTVWVWNGGWWREIKNGVAWLQRELARIRKRLFVDSVFKEYQEELEKILDIDIVKFGVKLAREILPNTMNYVSFSPERYIRKECYPVFCKGKHYFVYKNRIEEKLPSKRHYNPVGIPWTPKECSFPNFQKWLDDLFDKDTQKTILQILAWVITPVSYCPHIVFLYGDGNTGKSTFLRIIRLLVGANNVSAVSLTNLNTNSVVRLTQTMVNIPSEGSFTTLPEDMIKAVSDQESIEVRPLYKDYYTAVPTAKLIQAWNKLPPINDFSQGFWRRIIVIPFEKEITNPDPFILNKIRKEIPGILHYLIYQELPDLLRNKGAIYQSKKVKQATLKYNEENSSIILFFQELQENPLEILKDMEVEWKYNDIPGLLIPKDTLYKAFSLWCVSSGMKPFSKRNFLDALQTLAKANKIPQYISCRSRKSFNFSRCFFFPEINPNGCNDLSDNNNKSSLVEELHPNVLNPEILKVLF